MGDEREDDQFDSTRGSEPTESTEPTGDDPGGADAPEEIRIQEMSPPPPPAASDEPTSIGHPIAPPAGSPAGPPSAGPPSAGPGAGPPFAGPAADRPAGVPVGPGPDPASTGRPVDPVDDRQANRPWPSSATAVVAVLVVLVLLGVAGTVVGFSQASSADDDVEALEAELATAEDRVVALEDQLASLGDETGNLSSVLDELTGERDEARAERDELVAERDELVAERDQAVAERDEQAAVAEAEEARLQAEIEELETQLGEVQTGIDESFPLTVDSDLGQVDLAGNYDVSFVEIGCAGLDVCGSTPGTNTAAITTAGGLRLVVPDLFDIPLVVVEGTPFGVADSQGLVGPCGDVPRTASLTMALFDDEVQIGQEGDVAVTSLGATIVIDAPAVDDCEIGRVWYRASLTPQG